jgi:hypothetical protein
VHSGPRCNQQALGFFRYLVRHWSLGLHQHCCVQGCQGISYFCDATWCIPCCSPQNNPTEQLHPAAELVSSSVDSLASEMLLRGILLTTFTGWLCDRAYEGGWLEQGGHVWGVLCTWLCTVNDSMLHGRHSTQSGGVCYGKRLRRTLNNMNAACRRHDLF